MKAGWSLALRPTPLGAFPFELNPYTKLLIELIEIHMGQGTDSRNYNRRIVTVGKLAAEVGKLKPRTRRRVRMSVCCWAAVLLSSSLHSVHT